ncbi:ABC transporter permease [Rossellomorea sp. FS2]
MKKVRNSLKVAKWEFKRNVKNKSFLISLVLTPLIAIIFAVLPSLFAGGGDTPVHVYVKDDTGIWKDEVAPLLKQADLDWSVTQTDKDQKEMEKDFRDEEDMAYIPLTKEAVEKGQITYLTTEEIPDSFASDVQILAQPLQHLRLTEAGLTDEQLQAVSTDISFTAQELAGEDGSGDFLRKAVPGAAAGLVLFSIIMTGMMIVQSASQEKKEKVSEIILSSLTPSELMQGKIIGYFFLGILQVGFWIAVALPTIAIRFDEFPVMDYLLVPELLLLVFIALLGYLLFAALFVGLGATMEDMSSTSNFQGMILMLPFFPFILISPVLSDPNGLIATIASYVPFTSPAILILRLSLLDQWPWLEIIGAIAVLILSIWVMIKIAGKIFEVGILLYGKNASIGEIIKWVKS